MPVIVAATTHSLRSINVVINGPGHRLQVGTENSWRPGAWSPLMLSITGVGRQVSTDCAKAESVETSDSRVLGGVNRRMISLAELGMQPDFGIRMPVKRTPNSVLRL